MFDFMKVFPWDEFYDLTTEIYAARKKSSEGGQKFTPNEIEAILEKGRTFYTALEGCLRKA